MIVPMSRRLIKRAFGKTSYRFMDRPQPDVRPPAGLYVHVPFCKSLCSFCPFYKELYNYSQCSRYIDTVISEIESAPVPGSAKWLHFGGGTPNLLTVHQLARIKDTVLARAEVERVGIELLPDVLNAEYIKELRIARFTDLSLGVESLQADVLRGTGRAEPRPNRIAELVKEIKYRGLWLNLDFMIGLPNQSGEGFLKDMKRAVELEPDQVTAYPFMEPGNNWTGESMPDRERFESIEEAGQILIRAGYRRTGLWTFARGKHVYDPWIDELTMDFLGFGPSAMSSWGQWRFVNPELSVYLNDSETRVFAAQKTENIDDWLSLAAKLHAMELSDTSEFVKEQRKTVNQMRKSGLIAKNGQLTEKGIIYAHGVMKMIMSNLPHPLHNPAAVENHDEYIAAGGQGAGAGP